MTNRVFQVWHAGGDPKSDGVTTLAASIEEAAQLGASFLFEPHDPIARFDVFVQEEGAEAVRFSILVDVTRVRFDQASNTMEVKAASFTPARFDVAPGVLHA